MRSQKASILQKPVSGTKPASESTTQKGRKLPKVSPVQKTALKKMVQLVMNGENVREKAAEFLKCHDEEKELIFEANKLLEAYSNKNSTQNYNALNSKLPGIRDAITEKTDKQAGIISEYATCGVTETRKTFINEVLKAGAEGMQTIFDQLINQTVLSEGVDEKFKNRFLSYVLQSCLFSTGKGRVVELMSLIGDKEIKVGAFGYGGPVAGMENPDTDNPKMEKLDGRDKRGDQSLLETHKGNLAEFVRAKALQPDNRRENPQRGEIGNLQIYMDKSSQLLPVYYGLDKKDDVQAFTSPLFTAIHHELGHMVNALKGKHGRKQDKYGGDEGDLTSLTDEEELQNISLDRYSDKAFTDELGLPERIAHKSLGGLDSGSPNSVGDVQKDIKQWERLTYNLREPRLKVLGRIRTLTGSDWGKTIEGSKKGLLTAIFQYADISGEQTSRGLGGQLDAIRKFANDKFSTLTARDKLYDFFTMLATMNFDSEIVLEKTLSRLTEFSIEGWTEQDKDKVWKSRKSPGYTSFPKPPGE